MAALRNVAAQNCEGDRTLSRMRQAHLQLERPTRAGYDEYVSDPNKPVPYIGPHGAWHEGRLHDGRPALRRHPNRCSGL